MTHNKKTRALIEIRQMNDGTNHPVISNPLGAEDPETVSGTTPQSFEVGDREFLEIFLV